MDMMETIELEDLGDQARQVLEELMEVARLKPGQILVVGCSSSEIDSFKIGSHSSAEIGMAVYTALYQELKPKGIYLAAQCCEHLNRALILEAEAAQAYGYEPVNVVPQLKAGGSFATAAYATLEHPVAFESVMLVYRSSSTSYSVSVTLQLTSIPSFEIYTWTVSHRLTRSDAAISSYPGVCQS